MPMVWGYDHWKQTNPDELVDYGDPPEVWVECLKCCGEGFIEIWESVSKWSIDPPCAHSVLCTECNGAGGFIEEAKGDGA